MDTSPISTESARVWHGVKKPSCLSMASWALGVQNRHILNSEFWGVTNLAFPRGAQPALPSTSPPMTSGETLSFYLERAKVLFSE